MFRARFRCRPAACAPWAKRGQRLCCCADATLELTPGERIRLGRQMDGIWTWLRENPRRFGVLSRGQARLEMLLEEDGETVRRPGGRCIFSFRDERNRIRCGLYRVARQAGTDVVELQPYACRIFPLVLARLSRGRILLSVINGENFRALQALDPARCPGLTSPGLPSLLQSMSGTIDWLFGKGFSALLASGARYI